MELQERIDNLKEQKKIAYETYLKCHGAIDILTEMLNEEVKKDEN